MGNLESLKKFLKENGTSWEEVRDLVWEEEDLKEKAGIEGREIVTYFDDCFEFGEYGENYLDLVKEYRSYFLEEREEDFVSFIYEVPDSMNFCLVSLILK